MKKEKVLVIVGPTASGKTAISIELAKRLNGEIISADSMQIYKEMNIGTAKPTVEEMDGIPHHMIDIVDIGENFNVVKYQQCAMQKIEEILRRNKLPIIVGGTGLYINSIIEEIDYSETLDSSHIRSELEKRVEIEGNEKLYEELKQIDYEAYNRISLKDTKRIIRALEVYKLTGKTITEYQKNSKKPDKKYEYIVVGLNTDREVLYNRINLRVEEMMKNGLLNEAEEICAKMNKLNTSFQAIGYKEFNDYFNGECTLEEAKEKVKQESRRYAKRQLTWFRKNEKIIWFDIMLPREELIKDILNLIK